jgi:hypothetical protein
VFRRGTELDLFYESSSGGIDEIHFTDAIGFSPVDGLPRTTGSASSAPGAVVSENGTEVDVFYLGTDGTLRETYFTDATGWIGPLAPVPVPSPAPPPPTSTVTTTTVVTTPVNPPAPAPNAGPRVRVRLSFGWTWNRHGTRLRWVRAFRFPRRARLVVSCAGRGCPYRRLTAAGPGVRRLWRALERHLYRPGDRLSLSISEPGRATETVLVRIRAEALPKLRLE